MHAALQTAEIADGGPSLERTELWSEGSATLISLEGDQPGPRRGVASTFVSESGSSANIVAWSFETRMGIPQYNYAAAFCLGASCSSLALPNQGGVTPAVFPELASSGVRGSAVDRDVAQTFEVVFADPAQPATAATVLLAGTSRFTILSPDLTKGTSKPINPALFIVDVASGPIALPAGEVLGPSSVAVTADGQVLIAWVVRPNQNTAVLKTRRFQIKVCP